MMRALLLGSTLSAMLLALPAAAQQTGGTAGAPAGTAGGVAGSGGGVATGAPTSLLSGEGGLSQGLQRSLPTGLAGGAQLEGTNLGIETGTGTGGAIVTTPTPMNAPGTVLDGRTDQGAIATTPSPFDDTTAGGAISAVPPLSGTTVPALGGADAGTGLARRSLSTGLADGIGLQGQGATAADAGGGLFGAGQTGSAGQVQPGQQQAGPQIIVLSGSVLRGDAGAPNVIVLPGSAANAAQPRGLTRRLGQRQAVLQGTTQTPSVITLAPAPGNILVVQGSGLANSGQNAAGQGRLRAQIVELPAD